jgi:DNA-directed RNA polymerase specialized sigma24 family protein
MNHGEPSDGDLLDRVLAGDIQAAREIARRYVDSLHDFSLRLTLSPGLAAETTRSVLADVLSRQDASPGVSSLRSRLFNSARETALDAIREQGRSAAADALALLDESVLSQLPPTGPGVDPEVALWAWQSARSQRPRDYSLLDLAVRRGMSPAEVAAATSVSADAVAMTLDRLRESVEERFRVQVLFHRGRAACRELNAVVGAARVLGPSLRRDIATHAAGCRACREGSSAYPSPLALLAAFRNVEAADDIVTFAEDPEAEPRPSVLPTFPALHDSPVADVSRLADVEPWGAAQEGTEPADEAPPYAYEEDEVDSVPFVASFIRAYDAPAIEEIIRPPAFDEEEETRTPTPYVSGYDQDEAPTAEQDWPMSEDQDEEGYEEPAVEQIPVFRQAEFGRAPPAHRRPGRIQFARDEFLRGVSPPRRRPPWSVLAGAFGDGRQLRIGVLAIVAATALAIYLGLALGASIQSGGNGSRSSGAILVPTGTPGVQEIGCGDGPVRMTQGSVLTIGFDQATLPGYKIGDLTVQSASEQADTSRVRARIDGDMGVNLEVAVASAASPRADEYRVRVLFERGEERTIAECRLIVQVPASPATATPSPTPPATATSTPTVPPTAAPATVVPTQTPVPATATPQPTSTSTTVPTVNPTSTPQPLVSTPPPGLID